MTKTLTHSLLTAFIVILAVTGVVAQTAITDSVKIPAPIYTPDTLAVEVVDSLAIQNDTVSADSIPTTDTLATTPGKWNFLKGGNDSTYFSFYGHLLEVDDTIRIEYWNYKHQTHELELHAYDSSLTDLHIFHPAYRNSFNNSYLGNTGNAVKSNLFFEPNPETGFVFLQAFTPYIFQSANANYYKVQVPFTKFRVDMGPKDEQNIDLLHTQNINKYLNAFIHFKNYTGDGQYIQQSTRNNTGIFGGSYNQGRFATHANYVFSRISSMENGGVGDTYFITDTTFGSTNEISTRLTGGSTYFKDRQLFFDQKVGFFKTNVPDTAERGAYWFSLQYNYQSHKSMKVYEDTDDTYINNDLEQLHLYANNYSNAASFDSTFYRSKKQFLRINLEENPKSYPFVGAFFGVGWDKNEYAYFNKDTLFNYSNNTNNKSQYFEAGIYRVKGKKFKFAANYTLFVSGYRQNDFILDGFISQQFGKGKKELVFKAEGSQLRETPDYLMQKYYSNHYRWNNNFDAQFRTNLKFSMNLPHHKTKLGGRFSVLSNYIYMNNDALPEQYSNAFSAFDIYLNNQFEFWKFGTVTRINYQKTTNDRVLPLPELSGYFALYFAPDVYFKDTDGRMRFQLGADVYYWTSYYGQAYSPALAMFHNQNEQLIGNYPFVGAFWNVEIKRMRFYIRYEHLNYQLMETNYFLAPSYPANPSTLRYGLVWTFYN
ncbi:MAG: putative porin [Salinivirgaceae bacterium]